MVDTEKSSRKTADLSNLGIEGYALERICMAKVIIVSGGVRL